MQGQILEKTREKAYMYLKAELLRTSYDYPDILILGRSAYLYRYLLGR